MRFATCLYTGEVFHRRLRPRIHAMRYRVFSLLIDLDELDRLDAQIPLFSRNRFNLFSFHDADFGEQAGESVKASALARLEGAGIGTHTRRILLSCYPRILGYAFNPLSLFYCFDEHDELIAVIHEVHNTFGERHSYVLPVTSGSRDTAHTPDGTWINQSTDKALFVSPFAHMNMHYRFRLNCPGQRQVIVIRAHDDAGTLITASYVADRRTLSSRALLAEFFRLPLMTLKVIVGIHFEALRLWIKRVPWFTHQPKGSG